jgi:pyruvate dehydrogenase E2 component (dihydrolipoamide acetyltransferase)
MPKMGDGMEEGTINVWLKKEGDQVNAGDPIAEVETDKANVEIAAYETGVLTKIVVPEGKTVPVGEVIAMIGDGAAPQGNGSHAPAGNPATAEPTSRTQAGNGGGPVSGEEEKMPPVVESEPKAAPQEVPAPAAPGAERVKASPLARRMAAEFGIDLARISGTGPGGRIVERDVKAYEKEHPEHTLARSSPSPTAPVAVPTAPEKPAAPLRTVPTAPSPALTGQDIKPSNMRKAIASRTVQSKQNVPHFYVTMVIEMDRAQALLKELNADAPDGKITVNDVIVKACAVALGKAPEVNAAWTPEGTIRRYTDAHIGIAVGIEEGLVVPVVRDCDKKPLRQISAEARALIQKARNSQLKPEDYSGGTFSVSNLGMMGVDEFIAIINPPEAAILAIGGIVREPVVKGDSDEIEIRARMKVTISADHRLLDGVIAARFLQEVKKALEAPFSLLS